MTYKYTKETSLKFEDAIWKLKEELKKEGFGVLTEIDVKKTLKEKLDVNYDNYTILGACNPPFAFKALQTEKNIGLMLPCNVIVYSEINKTFISAINPVEAMSIIENPKLMDIAIQIKIKLEKIVNNVR